MLLASIIFVLSASQQNPHWPSQQSATSFVGHMKIHTRTYDTDMTVEDYLADYELLPKGNFMIGEYSDYWVIRDTVDAFLIAVPEQVTYLDNYWIIEKS